MLITIYHNEFKKELEIKEDDSILFFHIMHTNYLSLFL